MDCVIADGQPQLIGLACDVTNADAVQEVLGAVQKQLGPVHTLVNAAGINRDALLVQTKHDDVMAQINTNLVGTIHTCKVVVRSMMRNKQGCIINIGRPNKCRCVWWHICKS